MKLFLIGGLVFLITSSCGIKGPPLPPLNEETIQKQKGEGLKPASGDQTKAQDKKSKKK